MMGERMRALAITDAATKIAELLEAKAK
jgi:hypothetical protein